MLPLFAYADAESFDLSVLQRYVAGRSFAVRLARGAVHGKSGRVMTLPRDGYLKQKVPTDPMLNGKICNGD
jgi:hypothetical protein